MNQAIRSNLIKENNSETGVVWKLSEQDAHILWDGNIRDGEEIQDVC